MMSTQQKPPAKPVPTQETDRFKSDFERIFQGK
jgi:hypothetical protein